MLSSNVIILKYKDWGICPFLFLQKGAVMAKRKPKLTDVQNKQLSDVKQAYRKERQRIQRQINRMTTELIIIFQT